MHRRELKKLTHFRRKKRISLYRQLPCRAPTCRKHPPAPEVAFCHLAYPACALTSEAERNNGRTSPGSLLPASRTRSVAIEILPW
jgi:hypothetical protein